MYIYSGAHLIWIGLFWLFMSKMTCMGLKVLEAGLSKLVDDSDKRLSVCCIAY